MANSFSSDAAFEGLPEEDRGIRMPQRAEKTARSERETAL